MGTKTRGFASMNIQGRQRIARLGGIASQQKGVAHIFTHDEAVAAGRKGGLKSEKKVRAILQFTSSGVFMREWYSIAEAAKYYDTFPTLIIAVCKGRKKLSSGFMWKYKSGK